MKDSDPFNPSRPISGFKTGALGMGHVVLHAKDFNKLVPFYKDLLDFKISDNVLPIPIGLENRWYLKNGKLKPIKKMVVKPTEKNLLILI